MKHSTIIFYVLYGPNNAEHQGSYVLRRWVGFNGDIVPDTDPHFTSENIAEVRQNIPPECTLCIPRHQHDNVAIIETWI